MRRPIETSYLHLLPLSSDPELQRNFSLLLEVLDNVAEQTALAYVGFDPRISFVTAAIDDIRLNQPFDVTRELLMSARVNYVGKRSLEIGIRVEQPGDPPHHYVSSYFTMVAQGDDDGEIVLPPLRYEDPEDIRRFTQALERREKYRDVSVSEIEPPGAAESALLAQLHMAQEGSGFDGLLICNLTTRSHDGAYPDRHSVPPRIVGGYVAHRAYVHAETCAELVAPDRVAIVAANRINFLQPVLPGDKLHFTSRVTYTGETSICVEVDIVRESRDRTTAALSNTCTFTFQNVDEELHGRPVPRVYPTTYAEDLRYLAAHRRRNQSRLTEEASSEICYGK